MAESLDRGFIVDQLANTAFGIRQTNLDERGEHPSSTTAMARALLTVGRRYLDDSLSTFRNRSSVALALPIDDYLSQMGWSEQAEKFGIGVSFGIIGSAILRIERDEDYLINFNNYISGTPIPVEPTEGYRQTAVNFRSKGLIPDLREESARLRRMAQEDPTLMSILSDLNILPAPVRIQLFSLSEDVRSALGANLPLYSNALRALELDMLSASEKRAPETVAPDLSVSELSKVFRTPDQKWINRFGDLLSGL